MATAGTAIAVSAAPVAGVPFFAAGLTTAGTVILGFTFGGGSLMLLAVTAAAGSAILLAAGPAVRAQAISKLKLKFKNSLHEALELRVLGDATDVTVVSLKQTLFVELQGVALKRMEMAE